MQLLYCTLIFIFYRLLPLWQLGPCCTCQTCVSECVCVCVCVCVSLHIRTFARFTYNFNRNTNEDLVACPPIGMFIGIKRLGLKWEMNTFQCCCCIFYPPTFILSGKFSSICCRDNSNLWLIWRHLGHELGGFINGLMGGLDRGTGLKKRGARVLRIKCNRLQTTRYSVENVIITIFIQITSSKWCDLLNLITLE